MPEQKKPRRTQFRAPGHSDAGLHAGSAAAPGRAPDPLQDAGEQAAGEPHPGHEQRFPVACVVASAGGRGAIAELLRRLPSGDTSLCLVLIYSADPGEIPVLELAAQSSPLPVTELRSGASLMPGHVQVLPLDTRATLDGVRVELAPRGEGGPSPADTFLRSLATELGSSAVGVVLSGVGSDGALGLKDVKAEGGVTFAEDPRTAERPALPRNAVAAGGVDFPLGVEAIAAELVRMGRPGHAPSPWLAQGTSLGVDPDLSKLFRLLHAAVGVDFSHYKKSTLKRRIQRRMTLHKLAALQEYLDYLRAHPEEIDHLYQDLLIKVTTFFRVPGAFAALKTHVFPVLMHKRPQDSPVRIWVPGCSTGEEVYSLAISLLEFLEADASDHAIQIFGTDLSEGAIQQARAGIYIDSISSDVSPSRLRRFFVRVHGGFQVNKSVRDLCIFSRHNAAADPPLAKLDLISCRNLMIYMEPSLQRRLLHTFHQALKPTGFFLLGSSESITTMSDLFGVVDRTHRIFCKRAASDATSSHGLTAPAIPGAPATAQEPAPAQEKEKPRSPEGLLMDAVRKEADAIVMARYAPAGVVVDEEMQIVQFRGKTGPYLEPAPGDASLHLFKMAREGLLLGLRAALDASMNSDAVARKEQIKVRQGDRLRYVDVEVWPLKVRLPQGRCFLVVFSDSSGPRQDRPGDDLAQSDPQKDLEIAQLRRELVTTREYLQSLIDELEATNEELLCTNEELLASNDELHRMNDALESAREELQSANQELTAINEELRSSNVALGLANDDLRNLLGSMNIPVLMLDADLRIRRVAGAADKLLGLAASDVGRSILEVKPRSAADIAPVVAEVLDTRSTVERQVEDREGRLYLMRARPFRTTGNEVDGAVICWLEGDAARRAGRELAGARDRISAVFAVLRHPFLLLDGELRIRAATRRYCELFMVPLGDIEGRPLSAIDAGWNTPQLEQRLRDVLRRSAALVDFRLETVLAHAGRRTLSFSAFRLEADEGELPALLLAVEDRTGPEKDETPPPGLRPARRADPD
ncbi:CheR family methyltransferase [Sorangium sp. So ce260]|uniref:CheR family methyltransferase n=1 Tax=Sorangium sp. So ce260 TaxID=3133291 RepID=UPI003F5F11BB